MNIPDNIKDELLALVKNCKTPADLVEIAKRNNISLTQKQAEELFEKKDELLKGGLELLKGKMSGDKAEGVMGLLKKLGDK